MGYNIYIYIYGHGNLIYNIILYIYNKKTNFCSNPPEEFVNKRVKWIYNGVYI